MNIFSWTLEDWNTVLQFGSLALLLLTFVIGGGAILTGYFVGKIQSEKVLKLEGNVSEQQVRAADAEKALVEVRNTASNIETDNLKLRGRVASLDKEAADSRTRQAEAETRLAVAETALETERKGRLALQAAIDNRILIQTEFALSRLRKFAGSKYAIGIGNRDPETRDLAEQINFALSNAGWILIEVREFQLSSPSGVLITSTQLDSPAISELLEYAEANELRIVRSNDMSAPPDGTIGILVLAKPSPNFDPTYPHPLIRKEQEERLDRLRKDWRFPPYGRADSWGNRMLFK